MFTLLKWLFSLVILLLAAVGCRCLWCLVAASPLEQQTLKEIIFFVDTEQGTKEGVISTLTSLAIETGDGVRAVLEKPQQLKLTERASAIGLQVSSFKKKAFDREYSLYLLNRQAISGTLLLQAFNDKQIEIGRASTSFKMSVATGEYINFSMPKDLRLADISYFTLDYEP